MTRRAKIWRVVAVLFTLVNLGGAGVAAVSAEPLHTAAHVALMFLGAYAAWRLTTRGQRQAVPSQQLASDRLDYLQQSVDAIAIEVERIGEAQRFADKLRAGRPETSPPKRDS